MTTIASRQYRKPGLVLLTLAVCMPLILWHELVQMSVFRMIYSFRCNPLTTIVDRLDSPDSTYDKDYLRTRIAALSLLPDHCTNQNLAGCLERLAVISCPSEACRLYEEAISIRALASGGSCREATRDRRDLALVLIRHKEFNKATLAIKQNIDAAKLTHGSNSLEAADCMIDGAELLSSIPNYSMEVELLAEALRIRQSVLGINNMQVETCLARLGQYYENQGDFSKAEAYYSRRLMVARTIYGDSHASLFHALIDYARLLKRLGKPRESSKLEEHAQRLPMSGCGPLH